MTKAQEILDFLNSIEGAGYGGMAAFEIARSNARDMINVPPRALSLMEMGKKAFERFPDEGIEETKRAMGTARYGFMEGLRAALSVPPGDQAPQTLGGMIAAIYGELDAEDCNKIDRAWIEWRGRGTITYALASEVKKPRCDGADDLEHLDGMLDDRERGQ